MKNLFHLSAAYLAALSAGQDAPPPPPPPDADEGAPPPPPPPPPEEPAQTEPPAPPPTTTTPPPPPPPPPVQEPPQPPPQAPPVQVQQAPAPPKKGDITPADRVGVVYFDWDDRKIRKDGMKFHEQCVSCSSEGIKRMVSTEKFEVHRKFGIINHRTWTCGHWISEVWWLRHKEGQSTAECQAALQTWQSLGGDINHWADDGGAPTPIAYMAVQGGPKALPIMEQLVKMGSKSHVGNVFKGADPCERYCKQSVDFHLPAAQKTEAKAFCDFVMKNDIASPSTRKLMESEYSKTHHVAHLRRDYKIPHIEGDHQHLSTTASSAQAAAQAEAAAAAAAAQQAAAAAAASKATTGMATSEL